MPYSGLQSVRPSEITVLYARLRKPLLAFFSRRKSPSEAEDLTQEVFLRLARHSDLDHIDKPEAYVFQVAANLLNDDHRRATTRVTGMHTPLDDAMLAPALSSSLVERCDPERVLLGKRDVEIIANALSAMPQRTRDIFILYRMERMRQRDIAAAMNISLSCVEKHLVKAIASLTKARDQG